MSAGGLVRKVVRPRREDPGEVVLDRAVGSWLRVLVEAEVGKVGAWRSWSGQWLLVVCANRRGEHFGIDLGRGWRGPGCRARRRRCARKGRRSGRAQWPGVMGPWLGCEGGWIGVLACATMDEGRQHEKEMGIRDNLRV